VGVTSPFRAEAMASAPVRKIIHIDMDAFYASVEQRDDPSLRGLPVAVGGSRERGVVMAASYEARAYGVRSAMPSVTARRKCPDLVFVRPRFEAYKAVSGQIRAIFEQHTGLIEPVALDEAYLDVTENRQGLATATEVARAIRAEVLAVTGLVASAGVSYNKFLAKVASDHKKPDALFVITPATGPAFVEALPIGRFHGVGPVTEAKLRRLGIHTGADLKGRSLDELQGILGSSAAYYHGVARGIDERPVRPNRERKSVGAESTFADDTADPEVLAERLQPLIDKVWGVCEARGLRGRTVTLKIKFSDFTIITRSRSGGATMPDRATLAAVSVDLLQSACPLPRTARLIGVSVSAFEHDTGGAAGQLGLAI
jgi:DNA polymerase-4